MPIALVQHRWCIPILAETHRLGGARFAAYRGHLGISRDALTSTLSYLMELGLLERNSGYGHPLRPEYVATRHGSMIGPACVDLDDRIRHLGVEAIALRKWSLPVVGAVHGRQSSFALLRRRLRPITPRALSKSLVDLGAAALIRRDGETAHYALAPNGTILIPPLMDLCARFSGDQA
ncbi:MAG: winged helix-turn-helix transcriptional regulator [Alphaproteobacteria bacterium]|nr:winged helix-turn-helix transcriptional regulator [Alphaproteobacteria bacterium]